MKFQKIAVGLMVLCAHQAQAFHLEWMSSLIDEPFQPLNVNQLDNAPELFDCGDNAPMVEFCSSAEVPYYKTPFFAEVSSREGLQSNLYLYREYSLIAYSDVMINLRKDGFTLVEAHINDKVFDVREALKNTPSNIVNRDLVRFLNQQAKENQRKLIWQKLQTSQAVVSTDRYGLSVTFEYMLPDNDM
ncbi:hypothetical protein [Vibrio sp. SCSIO 43136]|uniref:hypothetical protein n=1 Tax=Vibrio sp. SCSIO 43136 TaxID=2819101 RepID=UPI0020751DC7|nr:hypothetical protein [Vibrio sp. SCSIO 43136]USD67194.1 hypothetical protein J4N39_21400 [Vibrio sp. SCSIO 43136]